MKNNELYIITRGDEHHYFTSLHKIGKYLKKQRTLVEYSLLKNKNVDGWSIDVVDGSKVMWEDIDQEPHDGYKALLQEMKDRNLL